MKPYEISFPIHFSRILLSTLLLLFSAALTLPAQVLTRSYNNRRTGANTSEATLTPANVGSLKKLREISLDPGDDPRIEAQPLYIPHLDISGTPHDVLIVCTMANNIYAFDANSGAQLWRITIGTPVSPKVTGRTVFGLSETEIDLWGINIKWGILSTPVIDIDTKTLYVVGWTSPDGTRANALHKLHAINLANGAAVHPAITIQASALPNSHFSSPKQKQRSALLLSPLRQPAGPHVKKTLFMACGMTGESTPGDHGWVIAFDVDSFHQIAAWTSTPHTMAGGIWQAGQGPASDDQGNVYAMTSNGGWNGTTDFAESFVRLHSTPTSLALADWFTPFRDNQRPKAAANGYDFTDQDLGSAGPILPENTNLLVGAGKDGVLYVFNRNNLGKHFVDQNKSAMADNKPLLSAVFFTYFPGTFAINPLVNVNGFPDGKTHHLHGSPIAWTSDAHGPMLFVWGENAPLRSWSLKADGSAPPAFLGESNETASAFSGIFNAMPGGMITLSANGGKDGIVWGSVPLKGTWSEQHRDDSGPQNEGNANQQIVEGVLRAYDAVAFDGNNANGNARMKLLWQSTEPGTHPGDARYTYNKFNPPVVAGGKVFLPTYDGRVIIFGL